MSSYTDEKNDSDDRLIQVIELLHDSQLMNQNLMAEQASLVRRTRRQFAGLVVLALLALVSVALATGGQQMAAPQMSMQPGADRAALMAMLGDEERQQLEEFESQVQWLSAYMKSSPDFDPGAAVALFLSQVAGNMEAVPKMHSEMQVMNARMAAVPAMVVEMQAINAKLAVMTGAMDSTMGRAGRMFPWMPFAP